MYIYIYIYIYIGYNIYTLLQLYAIVEYGPNQCNPILTRDPYQVTRVHVSSYAVQPLF